MSEALQIGPLVTLALIVSGGLGWGVKNALAGLADLRNDGRGRDRLICALETRCAVLEADKLHAREVLQIISDELARRVKLQEDVIPEDLSKVKELAARVEERLKSEERKA